MLEPEDIAEYQERRMRVVERSTSEREQETRTLFHEIQPYLDKGYSYNQAVKKVKGLNTVNTNQAWYREVIEYGEKQGYRHKDYNYRRRP